MRITLGRQQSQTLLEQQALFPPPRPPQTSILPTARRTSDGIWSASSSVLTNPELDFLYESALSHPRLSPQAYTTRAVHKSQASLVPRHGLLPSPPASLVYTMQVENGSQPLHPTKPRFAPFPSSPSPSVICAGHAGTRMRHIWSTPLRATTKPNLDFRTREPRPSYTCHEAYHRRYTRYITQGETSFQHRPPLHDQTYRLRSPCATTPARQRRLP